MGHSTRGRPRTFAHGVLAAAAICAGFGAPLGTAARAAAALAPRQAAAGGTVLDGVYTPEQAARGERVFGEACAACHEADEFAAARFRLAWVGRTAGDLFDAIATLMPEGDPGSLRPAEYAAIVAYLLQVNGYPAGAAPLPADLPALRAVEIVEGRP